LQKLSDEKLVALLASRNAWQARHAQRILQERTGRVTTEVERLMRDYLQLGSPNTKADQSFNEVVRLRALWALDAAGKLGPEHLMSALLDPNEYIRAWAIQFLCEDMNAL